jgi:hypothetical protein
MQVTGRQLSEELLDLLPDYKLAWTQQGTGGAGALTQPVPAESGAPSASRAPAASGAPGGSSWGGGGNGHGASDEGAGGGGGFVAYYRTASTQRLSRQYGDLMYRMRDLEVGLEALWASRQKGPRA